MWLHNRRHCYLWGCDRYKYLSYCQAAHIHWLFVADQQYTALPKLLTVLSSGRVYRLHNLVVEGYADLNHLQCSLAENLFLHSSPLSGQYYDQVNRTLLFPYLICSTGCLWMLGDKMFQVIHTRDIDIIYPYPARKIWHVIWSTICPQTVQGQKWDRFPLLVLFFTGGVANGD